jgi:hypothetical protein
MQNPNYDIDGHRLIGQPLTISLSTALSTLTAKNWDIGGDDSR